MWEATIRGVETGPRSFLDLLDPGASLTDDGADQDARDQETERIGLGMRARWLAERLVIQCANDQTEGLKTLADGTKRTSSAETHLCNGVDNTTNG